MHQNNEIHNNNSQKPYHKPQISQNSQRKIQIKTKEEFINEKLKQGFVRVKINFQYLADDKLKVISRKILVNQTQTLLQIQQSIKNTFFKILAEKNVKIRPEDGIFLFIKDQKIVQLRATVKEMANYMIQGPEGKYLEITGATVQKFGGF